VLRSSIRRPITEDLLNTNLRHIHRAIESVERAQSGSACSRSKLDLGCDRKLVATENPRIAASAGKTNCAASHVGVEPETSTNEAPARRGLLLTACCDALHSLIIRTRLESSCRIKQKAGSEGKCRQTVLC
jgi:hypothetical protein